MFILGIALGLALGLILAVDTRAEYNRWRKAIECNRKQIFCSALHDTDICDILAKKLEIQADGGDSAGDFVKQCVYEAWQEADNIK